VSTGNSSGYSDVTVINGATNTITATVPLGVPLYNLAINSVTNKIYASTAVIVGVNISGYNMTVINGVSRRSLPDVESAESIARGRSRAIVRVPWDDMLPVAAASPSTLRPQTRVAYTALAGVLVAGLAATPVRNKQ